MLVAGLLLSAWGIALLALARPLHAQWAQMIRDLGAAGYRRPPFGTRFVASRKGLTTFRVLGGAGLVAGAALVLASLLRGGT